MKNKFNGIEITYRIFRQNKQNFVLLLHGWGGNLNSFRGLETSLKNAGVSVISLDFPGFGGSEQPREDFCLDDYVKIVNELLKFEGVQNVSIVAHSFGGRVAIKFASKHQDCTKKLVLVDSAGIKPKFSLSKWIKIKHYKFLKFLKKHGIIKRELSNFGSQDYRAMPPNLKPVFSRIVCEDLTPYLQNILAPTLIVWGKDDRETPFYMAKKLNKKIEDSAIVTFDGGHFAYLQNESKFDIIVSEFLK